MKRFLDKAYLATLLSGAITGLAVYPLNAWYLFPLSLLGFFWTLKAHPDSSAFRLGLYYGIGIYFSSLNWIAHVLPLGLFVTLAPLVGLFYGAFAVVQRKWNSVWLSATLWTGFEFLRCEVWALKFPWSTPGVALGPSFLSPWLGVYGISFLVALACLSLIHTKRTPQILAACLLTVLIGAKAWNESTHTPTPDQPISVGLVQLEEGVMPELKALSNSLPTVPDITVWPEYALTHDPTKNSEDQEWLTQRGGILITGYIDFLTEERITENTAITIENGITTGRHVKNHTVHFFDEGRAGTAASASFTSLGKVGTPICFDGDYQDVYRKMALDGAQLFLAPTMDAIPWSRRQHLNHAELTRHRAAENGRWVGVAATSGRTQIIDPHGRRIASLPLMDPGVLSGEVAFLSHRTFFTVYGWLFGPICLALTTCLTIHTVISWGKTRFKKQGVST